MADTITPALEERLEQHRARADRATATGCSARRSRPRTPSRTRCVRAWREHRSLRGPRRAALVALPDRDERLPGHAQRPRAPGAADGPRAGAGPGRPDRRDPAGGRPGSSRCRTASSDRDGDPADVAESRETIRLAFVAALQHLPARQRAVLILCEVLRWKATEVAELLETSVASVNSALQRARATLEASDVSARTRRAALDDADRELLARYVDAFERYDMDALTALIREDATQSMPPYELWLKGRDDIFSWWFGPGAGCRGSRVIPAGMANGSPAFGQYKPSETRRRLRAVGAPGDRDRGRADRGDHVLPRHRARLPAVRPAAAARRT